MLGDVAGGVRFDEQVEVAVVFVRGDGRVGADNFFRLIGERGGDRHVLADGEAKDVGRAWEGKAIAAACQILSHGIEMGAICGLLHGDIMRKYGFFLQWEFLIYVGLQHLLDFCSKGQRCNG